MNELKTRLNELWGGTIESLHYISDPSRHQKTTGLGLSIAKQLVELLDGEIYAHMEGLNFVIVVRFKLMDFCQIHR